MEVIPGKNLKSWKNLPCEFVAVGKYTGKIKIWTKALEKQSHIQYNSVPENIHEYSVVVGKFKYPELLTRKIVEKYNSPILTKLGRIVFLNRSNKYPKIAVASYKLVTN